jgi:hypothetical protein
LILTIPIKGWFDKGLGWLADATTSQVPASAFFAILYVSDFAWLADELAHGRAWVESRERQMARRCGRAHPAVDDETA